MDDFIVYAEGICMASVCTNWDEDRVKSHSWPSGTTAGWRFCPDEYFAGNETRNGAVCPQDATRRHWLFEC